MTATLSIKRESSATDTVDELINNTPCHYDPLGWNDLRGPELAMDKTGTKTTRIKGEGVKEGLARIQKSADICLDCPLMFACQQMQDDALEKAKERDLLINDKDIDHTADELDALARIKAMPTGVLAGVAYTTSSKLAANLIEQGRTNKVRDIPDSVQDAIVLTKFGFRNQMNLYRVPVV